MLQLQQLDQLIIKWSIEKGITNFEKQKLKFVEEVGEMAGEILKNDTDKLKLEIGDVYVTIIIAQNLNKGKDSPETVCNVEFLDPYNISDIIWYLKDRFFNMWYYESIYVLKFLCIELKLDLTECVNLAYNKISKRDGVTIDGNFFKAKD